MTARGDGHDSEGAMVMTLGGDGHDGGTGVTGQRQYGQEGRNDGNTHRRHT